MDTIYICVELSCQIGINFTLAFRNTYEHIIFILFLIDPNAGPLIVKELITINDLWNTQLRESSEPTFRKKFLKTFLQYCTREVGPSFTRNMWKKNHFKWSNFIDENEIDQFIETNVSKTYKYHDL